VDDSTTVSAIIQETIRVAKMAQSAISSSIFEVYASRKSGKKISDLPSL
jgi:hypothetical protein